MRGADTDTGGRRTGPVDAEEHGEGIEKEELPAYESGAKSGPPRYMDVMLGSGGLSRGIGVGSGGQPRDESGGYVEMTNLNRHPADRPLGDPFADEDHGHERGRDGHRLSAATGSANGTGLDSRDVSPNPTTTHEHQHDHTNSSREQLTMPVPDAPSYTENH